MNQQDPKTRPPGGPSSDESLTASVVTNAAQAVNPATSSTSEALSHQGTKIISFRSLCRCGDEVWIENDGTIYRLRRTKLGKLILTK